MSRLRATDRWFRLVAQLDWSSTINVLCTSSAETSTGLIGQSDNAGGVGAFRGGARSAARDEGPDYVSHVDGRVADSEPVEKICRSLLFGDELVVDCVHAPPAVC